MGSRFDNRAEGYDIGTDTGMYIIFEWYEHLNIVVGVWSPIVSSAIKGAYMIKVAI